MAFKKKAEDSSSLLPGTGGPPVAASAAVATIDAATEVAVETVDMTNLNLFEELGLSPEDQAFVEKNTGLSALDPEDFRIPFWAFNVERELTAPSGTKTKVRKDQFFNVLTERMEDELEIIFMSVHKTNRWGVWSQKEGRTIQYCSSNDRKTGRMMTEHRTLGLVPNQVRPCNGCPQKQWREEKDLNTDEVRRVLACATNFNAMFVETKTMQPGVLRFRKSSERAFVQALNRFWLGKQKKRNKDGQWVWADYPFYSFVVKMTLEMDRSSPSQQFATPIFTALRPVTNKEEYLNLARQAKYLEDLTDKLMAQADDQEEKVVAAGEGEGDATDFDTSKLGGAATDAAANGGTGAGKEF